MARMSSMLAQARCASRSMRCGRRPRSTWSASTIMRRSPIGAMAQAHLDRALTSSIYDPIYLAGNLRGGEDYDWYYADDAAARSAQTRSDDLRRSGQAMDIPRQGYLELVGERALRTRQRRGACVTHRLGAAGQADLADRDRLSGRRQGRQPAEHVSRSKSAEAACPISPMARATISFSAAVLKRRSARSIPHSARVLRTIRSSSVYGGRMIDADRGPSVDLGRAALSDVSGRDRRVERRPELGDRPLAHRPARVARRSMRSIAAILDRCGDRAISTAARSGTVSTAM